MRTKEQEDSMMAQMLAGMTTDELIRLLGRVNDHIVYKERIEQALRSGYFQHN